MYSMRILPKLFTLSEAQKAVISQKFRRDKYTVRHIKIVEAQKLLESLHWQAYSPFRHLWHPLSNQFMIVIYYHDAFTPILHRCSFQDKIRQANRKRSAYKHFQIVEFNDQKSQDITTAFNGSSSVILPTFHFFSTCSATLLNKTQAIALNKVYLFKNAG